MGGGASYEHGAGRRLWLGAVVAPCPSDRGSKGIEKSLTLPRKGWPRGSAAPSRPSESWSWVCAVLEAPLVGEAGVDSGQRLAGRGRAGVGREGLLGGPHRAVSCGRQSRQQSYSDQGQYENKCAFHRLLLCLVPVRLFRSPCGPSLDSISAPGPTEPALCSSSFTQGQVRLSKMSRSPACMLEAVLHDHCTQRDPPPPVPSWAPIVADTPRPGALL